MVLAILVDENGQANYFIRPTYLKALEEVNLEPVMITGELKEKELREEYEKCDGVLFTGGWDIDPKYYGREPHKEMKLTEPSRDEVELKIMNWVKQDKKPFLGICRGEEVMNVSFGGTLFTHISDIYLEKHNVGSYANLNEVMHEVKVEEGTHLRAILNKKMILVNTAHRQAADEIGKDLLVSARSPEGVVEALEGVDKAWFLLGVQWHPEALWNEDSIKIFQAFAEAVEKRAKLK